jgi:hypothetical protein
VADAAAALVEDRRAFEPERAFATPPADFSAEDFFEREIGILCEQGNFERARVLLSRRALELRGEANVFYDGIRMERSASPAGEAWQAWAARALAEGAQIAPRLRALVPEDALRAYLVRARVGWSVLERQKDAVAARELLRLRLEHQLDGDPGAVLAAVEDPALIDAARQDPALLRIALGALAAALWREPSRAAALAQQYGVELAAKAADPQPGAARDPRALLAQASRLHGTWADVMRPEPCPAPLDRFVRVGRLVGVARARALAAALSADLRARPREYLRSATSIARAPDALATWLSAALQSVAGELDAQRGRARPPGPDGTANASDAALAGDAWRQELDERLQRCARAVGADPLRRLWLAALAASVTALALAWLATGASALLFVPAVLLPWPLRRSVDAVLYRRHVRGALLDAVVAEGADEITERMQASTNRALVRLAAPARADVALALVGKIAQLCRAAA